MTGEEKKTLGRLFKVVEEVRDAGAGRSTAIAGMLAQMEAMNGHLNTINGRCEKRGETIVDLQKLGATTTEALRHVAMKTATTETATKLETLKSAIPWVLGILATVWGILK